MLKLEISIELNHSLSLWDEVYLIIMDGLLGMICDCLQVFY